MKIDKVEEESMVTIHTEKYGDITIPKTWKGTQIPKSVIWNAAHGKLGHGK